MVKTRAVLDRFVEGLDFGVFGVGFTASLFAMVVSFRTPEASAEMMSSSKSVAPVGETSSSWSYRGYVVDSAIPSAGFRRFETKKYCRGKLGLLDGRRQGSERTLHSVVAMASISTAAPFGTAPASMALLAGGSSSKYSL